ncbi:uncharacterized protein Eint_060210 [Encephalitozoon intestinalis ATCC 50506]|uniref:Uncharacterized protein n=1 Tax=Encephalitozoon intestinalis (strain ATCC 50506) TaxID=876142 RepID=E0S7F1_ENCIT|nr:uncharacterized protein Eint_060210 [Encephalitozoon intestinalis ATCC 50506]ADM11630.1 hypothetical protein Eint_060210 [Encephalitozoon intestinalis ATCC 50506]UTX45362.1 hypothetical protein GPK93_06g09130 [Encephalitozoon intestinalis]
MEISTEESCSFDENLLDQQTFKNFLKLKGILKQFPKKSGIECTLCEENIRIRNLHDMFKAYACAVSCLSYHVESAGVVDFLVFFEVEDFVMKRIENREMSSVKEVLVYKKDTKEMYEEALRDQLIAVFKTHFVEKAIKINCEQDVESITYKYYKLVDSNARKEFTTKSLELLMVLLFRRNELIRFFKVFSCSKKSYAAFKLSLLLSMRQESHVSAEGLLKEFEDFPFEEDSLFPYKGSIESLCKVNEVLRNPGKDTEEWLIIQRKNMDWAECVQMWALNRENDPEAMDNSMMELCIRNKCYEDGWLIYENNTERTNVSVNKACALCFRGLKDNDGVHIWKVRMAEVVEYSMFSGDLDSLYVLIDDVMIKLHEISVTLRIFILRKFSKMIGFLHNNEDLIGNFLRALQVLCSKCQDSETHALCVRYSAQAYDEWKKIKSKKFLFFKKQSHRDIQIYASVLGIYGTVGDCGRFYNVYQDLLKSDIELGRELCARLESLHIQDCEECILRRNRIVLNKSGKAPPVFNFLNKP